LQNELVLITSIEFRTNAKQKKQDDAQKKLKEVKKEERKRKMP